MKKLWLPGAAVAVTAGGALLTALRTLGVRRAAVATPPHTRSPPSSAAQWPIHQVMKDTSAAMGRVVIQARAMRPATPQRTSPFGPVRPEPRMEPVATWVVDSAMPAADEDRMIAAEAPSAAMPCGESISTRPLPRVRMIRQPPR